MRLAWFLLGLALLAPSAVAGLDPGQPLLHAEGQLLAGTAGEPVGDPDEATPVRTNTTGPVSHAVHPFEVPTCPHFLGVQVASGSRVLGPPASSAPYAFDPALIRVQVHAPNGSIVASEFGNGNVSFMSKTALPSGGYELHLHHLVGGPIRYEVTVEGSPDPVACG